jgi:TonB family protein
MPPLKPLSMQQQSMQPAIAGPGLKLVTYETSPLWRFFLWSVGLHLAFIAQFLGFEIPLFKTEMKPRDLEFVLVDNSPKAPPRHKTRNRAEHASRSGGEKVANQPKQIAQRAAGAASKRSASRPTLQPKPTTRPSRQQPTPHPVARQAPPAPQQRPSRQVAQQPQTQPTPQPPRPTPPAPRAPRPTQTAEAPSMAPHPVAPTIRTPAPRNPAISASGPVARTPAPSGSSGSASGGGGNPGPSMIAGNPSRNSGGSSGSPGMSGRPGGSGGGGGHGSYSQSGSPGGGGGRAGIDAEAEPDFGPYIAELQRRIKRNWAPPTEDRNKKVVVIFHISRDGRLLSVNLRGSSGSPSADQAAIAAVKLSAPFRALPSNYRGNDIPVEFTFDYQVFGSGPGGGHIR